MDDMQQLNYTENHFIAISSHLPGVQKIHKQHNQHSTQLKTFTPVYQDTHKQIAVTAIAKKPKLIHIIYIHIDAYFGTNFEMHRK